MATSDPVEVSVIITSEGSPACCDVLKLGVSGIFLSIKLVNQSY